MWGSTYLKLVAALIAKNGSWVPNVPRMSAADMVGMLALYVGSIVGAIDNHTDGITFSRWLDDNGITINLDDFGISPLRVDTMRYVSRSVPVSSSAAWKRTLSAPTDAEKTLGTAAESIEPHRDPSLIRDAQAEQVHAVRQLVADYQRALDASGRTIAVYPFGIAGADFCKSFLAACRSMNGDLDSLAENPPTTITQDLKGALHDATTASGEALKDLGSAAGKVAGGIGNVAGDVGANFLDSFFSSANLTTIAVAGIVGYVAIRRYL